MLQHGVARIWRKSKPMLNNSAVCTPTVCQTPPAWEPAALQEMPTFICLSVVPSTEPAWGDKSMLAA